MRWVPMLDGSGTQRLQLLFGTGGSAIWGPIMKHYPTAIRVAER